MSLSEEGERRTERPGEIRAVPVRHTGRWIGALVVVIVAASLIRSAVVNKRFQWHLVGQYLSDHRITHGVLVTIELTVIAMAVGIVLGIVLAIMRLSPNPVVKAASWLYIWFFRGTPVYVQLLFWGFIADLYPHIDVGVPFGGPAWIHASANALIAPFTAAILGLGLNEGAYMAEIVRAGLISVDEGQTEAAHALGLSRGQTLRRIVLPQAMRVIIPPTGNETISMLKTTSLVVAIGAVYELLAETQAIYGTTYDPMPALIAASIWYLALTSVLYVVQYFIERRYGRGFTRAQRGRRLGRTLALSTGHEQSGPP
jgi:polar amino acid transport system permease protein